MKYLVARPEFLKILFQGRSLLLKCFCINHSLSSFLLLFLSSLVCNFIQKPYCLLS